MPSLEEAIFTKTYIKSERIPSPDESMRETMR